ncbi:MAG: hypothetical protein J6B96_01025 [Agathobacter sp.]|nr:hypothetical protein [Agathobacter sp.]
MKSNKEMIHDVFSRIQEEKIREQKRRDSRVYMASFSVLSLALLIGMGVWIDGQIHIGGTGPLTGENTQSGTEKPGTEDVETDEKDFIDYELLRRIEQAVWAKEGHYDGKEPDVTQKRKEYINGFDCNEELFNNLMNFPEQIYAIVVVPKEREEYKEATRLIKKCLDEQGIRNFVYMNRTNGQFNCYFLVTADELAGIHVENAQDYEFNAALKPANIEQVLFPGVNAQ